MDPLETRKKLDIDSGGTIKTNEIFNIIWKSCWWRQREMNKLGTDDIVGCGLRWCKTPMYLRTWGVSIPTSAYWELVQQGTRWLLCKGGLLVKNEFFLDLACCGTRWILVGELLVFPFLFHLVHCGSQWRRPGPFGRESSGMLAEVLI